LSKKTVNGQIWKAKASIIKKEQQELKFSFSHTSKLSSRTTCTIGADMNAREFLGMKGGDPISFGFEIKLK